MNVGANNSTNPPDPVRVLYMEDDAGSGRLFQRKLTRAGYSVDLAADGDQGLLMCKEEAYDVLVVDHKMPGKSGLEVIRELSNRGPMPPTIMVTGAGDETVAVEALKLDASDYIIKDVEGRYLDLLPKVIENALSKQRLLLGKQQAEEELQRARGELEIRVKERTAELAEALEQLRTEMTERVRAEEDLRESEQRYRSLVDNIDLGVTLIDEDFSILMTNACQARFFGQPAGSFVGRKCYEAFAGRDTVCRRCPDLVSRSTGRPAEIEARSFSPEGKAIDVRVQAFPIFTDQGRPTRVIEVVEDITDRKRLEEQLRHAVKMEAVGRLAGGVAHDFNNILTAIIGYSAMMLRQLDDDNSLKDKLVQISRAAERAAGLTRQLLAFSRKQVLDRKILDVNTVISDFEKILQRLIGEDITMVTILDPALGRIKADPSQIEQILLNLVVNARDAMPSGGKLTISSMNAALDDAYCRSRGDLSPGTYVLVSVTDTGHGMTDETRLRIFEPFFTTKELGKGTGLGLSTVYGIVKMHQGHVEVESRPGYGARFLVYLPQVERSLEAMSEADGAGETRRGKETVLVVEDEEMVRDLSCSVLEDLGYRVLKAGSPEEAFDACAKAGGPIHMLLTDVVLPQMDGRTLFNRLSTIFPGMRALFMSGYTDDFLGSRGLLDSGIDFLQKPFAPERLAGKVREILDASN